MVQGQTMSKTNTDYWVKLHEVMNMAKKIDATEGLLILD